MNGDRSTGVAPRREALAKGAEPRTALVLSGGGARAAYQVGVLAGIVERVGDARFQVYTGVSAGSINAASLASYPGSFKSAVDRLVRSWLNLTLRDVVRWDPMSLISGAVKTLRTISAGASRVQARGLLDTSPLLGMLAEHVSTAAIQRNIDRGRLHALGLSATSYATGRTVTFVHGSDGVRPWRRTARRAAPTRIAPDHVLASSALPIVFPAVRIGGAYYGDGSIRQTAPLAPAVHLGADRLLAVALRRPLEVGEGNGRGCYPLPAQVIGMLLNSVFLETMEIDAERLHRINRTLELLPNGVAHPDRLRPIGLTLLRPSRDLAALAADLVGHLPRGLRLFVRGLGSSRLESPDFLSYLLFERPYVERLLELGRSDALANWDGIARLLDPSSPGFEAATA